MGPNLQTGTSSAKCPCTGVLKNLYNRSYIAPIPTTTPAAMGLQTALESWRGMPEVGIKAAMRVHSAVGGQGMNRCDCRGKCDKGKCSCYRAGQKCNSRCHKNKSVIRSVLQMGTSQFADWASLQMGSQFAQSADWVPVCRLCKLGPHLRTGPV